MTFTYTEDLTVERDFVRFHAGDVREGEAVLSDEIIASLLAVNDSKEAAAIAALEHKIDVVNQPTFSADWLRIDVGAYVVALERSLQRKRGELAVTSVSRTSAAWSNVYRPDSQQESAEVYDADAY